MIEQYTSPVAVNRSQEPWLVGEGVVVSGGVAIPSLDFNFITGGLPGTVTFTRASTATYFDATGTLQSAAIDAPRFDYNPATLAARGILIEEARTNSIRNNTMQGAVAGTPGTLPSISGTPVWVVGAAAGMTTNVIAVGTSAGISYIDLQITGTATGSYIINFDLATAISASPSQTWAGSLFISQVGGTTSGVTAANLRIQSRDSGGASIASSDSSAITLTGSLTRVSHTATTPALTAYVQAGLRLGLTVGAAIDITLRIGLPQLELGAFATSVIPTTTTALTRSADVASVNTLSPWYNATEGTLFAQASVISTSYNQGVLADIGAVGVFGTTIYLNWNGTSWTLNPNTPPLNMGSVVTTSSTAKIAAALKANDSVISANGLIGVVDTSCALPSAPNALSIGKAGWSVASNFFNGWFQRITYYPRRLSNAELQALTA